MVGSLGMFIEALVAVLLVVTIVYCVQVNRKLEQVRSDESELHRIIKELSEATVRAEGAIANLRANAESADEQLTGHTDSAREASGRLRAEIAEAETLLHKLATIARTGSRTAAPAQPAPPAPPSRPAPPGPRASSIGIGLLNANQRNGTDESRSAA